MFLMKKTHTNQELNLEIDILKEGKTYIAYSRALDLASCGKTIEEARKSFMEAATLFMEAIIESGSYKEVLEGLGWQKRKDSYFPPITIARQMTSVRIPTFA